MGMNFYAKKINNKEIKQRLVNIIKDDMPTKQELYELINDGSIEDVYQKLYDLLDLEHYWKVNPPAHDCMYSHLNDE